MYGRVVTELNKNQEEKTVKTTDFALPNGVPGIIQGYLSNEMFSGEHPGSVTPLSFFGNDTLILAHQAAYYALWGHPKKFKDLITSHPNILLYRVEMVGPHGPAKGTLYQLLLRVDDNYIRDEQGKTFLELARERLGSAIAEKQKKAWLGNWDKEAHIKKLQTEFDKVAVVFDELKTNSDAKPEPYSDIEILETISSFQNYLSKITTQKIRGTDLFVNKINCIASLWDYASKFYTKQKYDTYGGYDSPKNKFFSFMVIGAIEWHLPAWGMQILNRSIKYVVLNKFEVRRIDVSPHYKRSPTSGLGVNCSMGLCGGGFRTTASEPQQGEFFSRLDQQVEAKPCPHSKPIVNRP